ncbi:hypothetical protein W823_09130 [Williamsia sp. D3]|nr:hypothetical protein W823_09130 [Williamsia sp. D3]
MYVAMPFPVLFSVSIRGLISASVPRTKSIAMSGYFELNAALSASRFAGFWLEYSITLPSLLAAATTSSQLPSTGPEEDELPPHAARPNVDAAMATAAIAFEMGLIVNNAFSSGPLERGSH